MEDINNKFTLYWKLNYFNRERQI